MTGLSIFKAIPGMVADHPHVQELSGKVKALCNGSEFERAAVAYYFGKVGAEHFEIASRRRTMVLKEAVKDLNALGMKEVEARIPGLAKSYPEGFAGLVTRQESEIAATVTQFIDVQLGLAKAFCDRFTILCNQVADAKMPIWEKEIEAKLDAKINAELSGKSESLVKAILEPLNLNRTLHLSDLEVKT
jgi:hypothetical protein